MKDYKLDSKYRYFSRSITKGTQEKYKKGDYFYKINKAGNEGFTEYLVTRLLKHSTLPDYCFVDYEYCKINCKLGCRSKSFLQSSNEEFVSMNFLYEKLSGNDNLSDYLSYLRNANDRLNFILSIVEKYGVDKSIYSSYLKALMQLDMLILNTDRHTHNYGLIYNKVINRFRVPPIFDNGLSLNTNRVNSAISCTLSGSFEEQVIAFGYPIETCFKIDYKSLLRDLNRIERYYGNHYEIDVLRSNLNEYKSLFELSTGC